MKIEIVSVEKKVFDTSNGYKVSLPTLEGIITILPGHEPIISALGNGEIVIVYDEDTTIRFASLGGVVESNGKYVRILCDFVTDGDGLSSQEMTDRMKRAQLELDQYKKNSPIQDPQELLELEGQYLREQLRARFSEK